MAETLTPLDELEAVNDMLSLIAESPLASLDEVDGVADAQIAHSLLKKESLSLQEQGWHWNTEYNFRLAPDADGNIILPPNTLKVDAVDESLDYVFRNGKLWDRKAKTFTIGRPVYLILTLLYDFADLPPTARSYIAVEAARKFENRMVSDATAHSINEQDAARAKAALMEDEADVSEANVIRDSRSVRRVVFNRNSY